MLLCEAIYYAAFNWIAALIVFALSTALSYLLQKKPPDRVKPAKFEDIKVPTCEIGTPYRVIIGTPARFGGTMVLWYGNFTTKNYEDHDVVVNVRYYMGMHFGLAQAHCDVVQMWAEDRCVYPTLDDPESFASEGVVSFSYDAVNLWGGGLRGGGVDGTCEVLKGASDQAENAYLTLQLSADLNSGEVMPRFKHFTSIVHRGTTGIYGGGAYWGVNPRFPIMSYVLRRRTKHHDGTAMWYSAKAQIGTHDLNVVHAIREWLVSAVIGAGIDSSLIDETSFQAAADTCYTENLGISFTYMPNDRPVGELIKEAEDIMDGVLYFDHATNKYKIEMARDTYTVGDLDLFTEDDFEIERFFRPTYGWVPSVTQVHYTNRASAERTMAEAKDSAARALQSAVPIVQSFDYMMIHDDTMATAVAAREQRHTSAMPAAITLLAKRTMYDLHRGSVFKISHPSLTEKNIEYMVVRVLKRNRGKLKDGRLAIDVVQDVYSSASVVFGNAPATNWVQPPEVPGPGTDAWDITMDDWTVAVENESLS